jgi:hypothetical protein
MKSVLPVFAVACSLLVAGCKPNVQLQLYDDSGVPNGSVPKAAIVPLYAESKAIQGKMVRVVAYSSADHKVQGWILASDLGIPNMPSSEITYRIKEGKPVKLIGSKPFGMGNVRPSKSPSGAISYIQYDDSNPYKWGWEATGILFFDSLGSLVKVLPLDPTDNFGGVEISPDDKYVTEDWGTSHVRALVVLRFPEMSIIAHFGYDGKILWSSKSFLVFNSVSPDSEQKPGYNGEDAYFHDVRVLNCASGRIATIVPHDLVTDYVCLTVKGGSLIVRKTSVPAAIDWAVQDKWISEEIALPLPR